MNNLGFTLTQIEGHDWGPPPGESHLVSDRLRNVPLKELGAEDLRLLIGQRIGLHHLIPLAIERLHHNPWEEGQMFPGDLLTAVATVPGSYWEKTPEVISRFQAVLDEVERRHRFYLEEVLPAWHRVFGGA